MTEPAYLPLFLTDAEIAEICAPLKVQGYLIKYPQCLRRNGRTGRIALSD